MIKRHLFLIILTFFLLLNVQGYAKEPYRMGTTTAGFLEIGIGGAGIAMGDAYVAAAQDMSAIYWNPAGLALMERNEAMFMYQPWVVDVSSMFAGAGLYIPRIGTLAIGLFGLNYGNIDVTTLDYQMGTGEQYTANDYNLNLSYARSLVEWFSFGASFKYVTSKIWHSNASAMAVDLGVLVQTPFFSPTSREEDGMRIGMSISNYGSRMRYDGFDLLFPEDMAPDEDGNYQNLQAKYKMSDWELPLMFRVGLAFHPIIVGNQRFTVEVDALHPNNMSEYVNIGGEYKFMAAGFGDFSLRAGYKGLFMVDDNYGPTFGGGIKFYVTPTAAVAIDYAYRTLGVLGNVHATSFNISF
ncbi:PorV/PorQ family protein [candidate division KSB1 bacterium]|nr:PorV/PorQ family protein [candidate division KSB1 bacterium]RQW07334.1 MAG: PorV/PorQ family protein [candidate division KSB1 bacterium]